MTYADRFASVGTTSLGYTATSGAAFRREAKANVGYLLFAFGVLWVLVIAAVMFRASGVLPQCQYTVSGDAVLCNASTPLETPNVGAGLDVSKIAVPANLSGSTYDAF
jgi:hypothetical protein